MFSRDMKNANILYFLCVMCQSKETIIKGQAVSLYNLKLHVKRKQHPAHAISLRRESRPDLPMENTGNLFVAELQRHHSVPGQQKPQVTEVKGTEHDEDLAGDRLEGGHE
ncbi:hypothetical protein OTU49_017533 [Cherax quadricarinatus]|uniref:Uncharacterized protein n=1 Tax=Cherax quadricarinatus TaxID=27406 RepID=A0AAW0Y7H3_CHEQU